jgi:hypothetical protein
LAAHGPHVAVPACVHVIPARQHTGDILRDTRVAVTNGLSEIIVEASMMGTPVIALPSKNAGEQRKQSGFFLSSLALF